jgi:hypothetical protein
MILINKDDIIDKMNLTTKSPPTESLPTEAGVSFGKGRDLGVG